MIKEDKINPCRKMKRKFPGGAEEVVGRGFCSEKQRRWSRDRTRPKAGAGRGGSCALRAGHSEGAGWEFNMAQTPVQF